jgi:hypothetical protein
MEDFVQCTINRNSFFCELQLFFIQIYNFYLNSLEEKEKNCTFAT